MSVRPARIAIVWSLLLAPLLLIACGKTTTSEPSPETIATADARSRAVTIPGPFATTPIAGDSDDKPVELEGHVFGSGPTGVVLAPMRTADQSSWFPFALMLSATGQFTVLTFDFRGFGQSTGEKEFDHLDTDMTAAYQYASGTLGMQRVFLVGATTGGSAALVVSSRLPVAGVISISAAAQFQKLDALAAVANITAPKLFVTSKDDVPAARSLEEMWAKATDPRQQQVYDGSANGTDLLAGPHEADFEQLMLTFLTTH